MHTRLERDYRFEAAHFLPKVPPGHKCGKMHGHSYLVRVAIEGEIGSETGWLIDFADLDAVVKPVIERLDHQTLDDAAGCFDVLHPPIAATIIATITATTSTTNPCVRMRRAYHAPAARS